MLIYFAYQSDFCRNAHLPTHNAEVSSKLSAHYCTDRFPQCKEAVAQLAKLVTGRSNKCLEIDSGLAIEDTILIAFYKWIIAIKPFLGFLCTALAQQIHYALCIDALASADMVVIRVMPTAAILSHVGEAPPWQHTFRIEDVYRIDLDEHRLEKLYHEICARRQRTHRKEDCLLVKIQLVHNKWTSGRHRSQSGLSSKVSVSQTLLVPIERSAWALRRSQTSELCTSYLKTRLPYPAQEDLRDLCAFRFVNAFGSVWAAQAVAVRVRTELSCQCEDSIDGNAKEAVSVDHTVLECLEASESDSGCVEHGRQLVCPALDTLIAAIVRQWLAEQREAGRAIDLQDYRLSVKPIMARLAQKVEDAKIERVKQTVMAVRLNATLQQVAKARSAHAAIAAEMSEAELEREGAAPRVRNRHKLSLQTWLAEDGPAGDLSGSNESPAMTDDAAAMPPVDEVVHEGAVDTNSTPTGQSGDLPIQRDVFFTPKPRVLAYSQAVRSRQASTVEGVFSGFKLGVPAVPRRRIASAGSSPTALSSIASADLSFNSSQASSMSGTSLATSQVSRASSMTSFAEMDERSKEGIEVQPKSYQLSRDDLGQALFPRTADRELPVRSSHNHSPVPFDTAVHDWLAVQALGKRS